MTQKRVLSVLHCFISVSLVCLRSANANECWRDLESSAYAIHPKCVLLFYAVLLVCLPLYLLILIGKAHLCRLFGAIAESHRRIEA